MKKSVFFLTLWVALIFTSCTKDQINPIQDTPEKAEARAAINMVSNSFLTGNWGVTYCINSNGNETPKYKDYSFGFGTNGSIVVKEGVNAGTIGKWVVSYIDGKARISFAFQNNSGFEALNGDWTMIDGSDPQKVPMQNVVEQKCYLTLEKL